MQGTVPSGSESLTLIEQAMAGTAVEIDAQLIAFVLPSTPESARMARFHAGRPKSRHTDGSSYADVYLPGPCTGR